MIRVRLSASGIALLTLLLGVGGLRAQPEPVAPDSFSFVVLGHVRGSADGLNYLLDELLAEVRELHPDLVFLTGDMIWGDVQVDPADSARIVGEWERLDSALATLDAPVYRVPGNHDINDRVTRDIYYERYGELPRLISYGNSRFLLLNSSWVPEDDDARKHIHIRGVPLDSAQVAFVARQLASSSEHRHAFVFMHHVLWWKDEARWWRQVHPRLVSGRVRAVFSGEYGPMKFSYLRRDGIDYYQSGIEPDVKIPILRARESSRLLAQQFDNYLYVTVAGDSVDVEVRTVGEVSSGHFTPPRWRAIHAYRKEMSLLERAWAAVGTPRRLGGLALLALLGWVAGLITPRLWSRLRSVRG